ncbi:MAG TPA: creatininase family protein [Candidatus Eisenbacteria bacterium]
MRITDMNWMQVRDYLERDNRAVLPLGSTEQHAYLSLGTDSILAERVAAEAAEPLGVLVFPVVAYGITPLFSEYPGTISLEPETHLRVVREILDGLAKVGFRRILIVNGHGGNRRAQAMVAEWAVGHPDLQVRFHDWWNAPRTWARVKAIDPLASHASWTESFPWTRVAGVSIPETSKPLIDFARLASLGPKEVRAQLGDGSGGGRYQRTDEEVLAVWAVAVEETRALLTGAWP